MVAHRSVTGTCDSRVHGPRTHAQSRTGDKRVDVDVFVEDGGVDRKVTALGGLGVKRRWPGWVQVHVLGAGHTVDARARAAVRHLQLPPVYVLRASGWKETRKGFKPVSKAKWSARASDLA